MTTAPVTPSVLIVEDDARLGELLTDYLSANSFSVGLVADGLAAVDRINAEQPHVVVLDLMLPGLPGLEVLSRVRPTFRGGILILTASKIEGDEIEGLERGADDFVTKPVDPRVLLARIRSVLRRAASLEGTSDPVAPALTIGALVLEPASRTARVQGVAVELTNTEWTLLWLLASRAGTVVSRDDLYTEGLGTAYDGLDRGVDIHLSRLRKKLASHGFDPSAIKSIRSVGYMMAR